MLVGHFSDLHGNLKPLLGISQQPDLWIWSGDIFPNKTRGIASEEVSFQSTWIELMAPIFKQVVGDKPLLIVAGNHDYVDPIPFLKEVGIDARPVVLTLNSIFGITYAGFPNIPYIQGEWNYETYAPEMASIVDQVVGESPYLLITHAPPGNILDLERNHWGITSLASQLLYGPHTIRYHAFGHVHAAAGMTTINDIFFSNAACRLNFFNLE